MENETIEETQDSSTEDVNIETNEGAEDTKDWKAEALKFKAIAERKDKKLQQAQTETVVNKTNTEQGGPTMEDITLINQGGYNLDEMNIIEMVARNENISKTEASQNDYVKTRILGMRQEATNAANSMGASGGSAAAPREKSIKEMTNDEHAEYGQDLLNNALNK